MTIIAFLFALSIIITVHELGHFLAAKKSGILVEEFNIGFPPRLLSHRFGETLYSLNLIPIGGYVKLFGEDDQMSKLPSSLQKRAFFTQSWPKKLLVVSAGVLMNFFLGVLIFASIYSYLGIPQKVPHVQIIGIAPNSPASQAGLKPGNVIVAVNGKLVKTPQQLIAETSHYHGQKIILTVANKLPSHAATHSPNQTRHYFQARVLVRAHPPKGQGGLGIVISNHIITHPPFWKRPFLGTIAGLRESFFWGQQVTAGLWILLRQLLQGSIPRSIAGPIGVYRISQQIETQAGWLAWIHFFGILSINLAIINILPLPALDGGQLVFVILEAVSRRNLNPKLKILVNQIGLLGLLFLLLLLTFHDLRGL